VAKPLRPDELFAALEGLVPGVVPAADGAPPDEPPALDQRTALARTGGDADLVKELAGLCLDECPRLMDEIRTAIGRRDGRKLRLTAHALRGSVAALGAEPAAEAAGRLEEIGRDEKWGEAAAAWAELEGAIDRLRPALADLGGVTV
jgi:HPt (histidine-containing phosphotransfer) domain-containing protein